MKKCNLIYTLFLLFFLLLVSATAATAASISYTLTDLNSQQQDLWQIDYQVSGFDTDTYQGFQILFDFGQYENISLGAYTSGWDAFEVQPDSILGIEEPGMLDAEALNSGGILAGTFSVRALWLGSGMPGPQQFFLYNDAFETIGSGTTSPVPEPAGLVLLFSGLAVLAATKRKCDN